MPRLVQTGAYAENSDQGSSGGHKRPGLCGMAGGSREKPGAGEDELINYGDLKSLPQQGGLAPLMTHLDRGGSSSRFVFV